MYKMYKYKFLIKLLMRKIRAFLLILGLSTLFLFSCDDEGNPFINEAPIINEQIFSINENSPNGTVVDTVLAIDNNSNQNLSFNIVEGNSNDVFNINENTGILYVNNVKYLDYEATPVFELTIEVTDNYENPLSISGKITINLLDIQPTNSGLVSYYSFENDVQDIFGENNGDENNVSYISGYPNKNNAVTFNGIDSYVSLQNAFDHETMTLNLWFNPHEITSEYGIVYTSDNPTLEYGLHNILVVKNNEGVNRLSVNVSGQNYNADLEEGEWYNIAIVRNNKNYNYYLNGEIVQSGSFENYLTSQDSSSSAILGCLRTLDNNYFKGQLDDVRIYNRELTKAEIKTIFQE